MNNSEDINKSLKRNHSSKIAFMIIHGVKKKYIKIIRYRPLGVPTEMIDIYSPTDELMNELGHIAEKNGLRNVIVV